ncbi:hypothetical protein SteCoe_14993 [Stentor coeruleus]|uniref:Uncharacterized protein n=1 Tax=Stentor coeruleus TaxID=5963 RepID=A0A1R2C4Q6_9CILI|nr:hypothetical protein SteCoe_14993 [Stentor coeruleus]
METADKLETIIKTLFQQAQVMLKELNFKSAYQHLDQALQILEKSHSLKKSDLYYATYTNYGTILKKQGNYSQAAESFLFAGDFCIKQPLKLAECYLNACAMLSRAGKHTESLKYSIKALRIYGNTENPKKIIAMQNAGAEYEYLGLKEDAKKMYKQGYILAKKINGPESESSLMFKRRYMKISVNSFENSFSSNAQSSSKDSLLKKRLPLSTVSIKKTNKLPDFISAPIVYETQKRNTKTSPKARYFTPRNSNTPVYKTSKTKDFFELHRSSLDRYSVRKFSRKDKTTGFRPVNDSFVHKIWPAKTRCKIYLL